MTALAAALALPVQASHLDPVPVRLMGINDFHGHLEAANNVLFLADPGAPAGAPALRVPAGGAAALAGLLATLRKGSPFHLTLGAGDLMGASPLVSSLFRHETTIDVLNDLGLEVSSVGNHEFDAGFAELQRMMRGGCAATRPDDIITSCAQATYRGAKFTYLGANVVDESGKPVIAPYTIKHFDGIPVAIIGAVTRTTPQMVTPSGVNGLRFLDEAESVNRAAGELRAKGVRAMVAVFHEGIELGTNASRGDWNDTTCPNAHGPLLDIARRLAPEIRVIFSGHTHQGYRCELEGRLLIQGTSYGRGVSVVDVELDRSTRAMLPPVRSINLPVMNDKTEPAQRDKLAAASPAPFSAVLRETTPDARIAQKVAAFAALVAPKAERPVGRIAGAFTRSGSVDSTVGRLIADAQLAATRKDGAQAAFMNPGGIRSNLDCAQPPCTVTFGQAFTVQPFGNDLVILTLTGAQLKEMLESQRRRSGDPMFLQPSEGFTYTWRDSAPPGQQVSGMLLGGEPVDPGRAYRITVNSFLAEGGDGYAAIRDGVDRKGGGPDIDALLAHLGAAERSPVAAPRVNRVP